MQFICSPCRTAADIATVGKLVVVTAALVDMKKRGHSNCKGDTWCDCQHRVVK